jgi:hypothetical protein
MVSMSLWWRVRRRCGDQPIASPGDPMEWIIVDPVNIEQLVCICGQECLIALAASSTVTARTPKTAAN